MPFGSLYFAWCTLMAVAPLRRPRRLAVLSWICSAVPNELPFLFLFIVVVSTAPGITNRGLPSSAGWLSLTVTVLTCIGLLVVARRAWRTSPRVEQAMEDALGPGWRAAIAPGMANPRRHLPWAKILFAPWPLGRHDVVRVSNVRYGDGGRENLLDVYRHRSRPADAPTLIYFHGGGFRWGRKSREARPLIHHLASQGWTCISANYHRAPTPAAGFPRHLVDVKKAIAWARHHGPEHGVDPHTIFLAGSSAGAHLSAMAALTANDPTFQPGFEAAETSVSGVIGLGGYYGSLGDDLQPASTPLAHVGPHAPPFFIAHGAQDTYVPVEGARLFADGLREASSQPVVYAELPGAQHAFDLFHSIRFETVVDAIEAFTGWVGTSVAVPSALGVRRAAPAGGLEEERPFGGMARSERSERPTLLIHSRDRAPSRGTIACDRR